MESKNCGNPVHTTTRTKLFYSDFVAKTHIRGLFDSSETFRLLAFDQKQAIFRQKFKNYLCPICLKTFPQKIFPKEIRLSSTKI